MRKDNILERCKESDLLSFMDNPFADNRKAEQVTAQVEDARDLWLLARMLQDIRHE